MVIGIDDYGGSGRDLKGCVADAKAVADRLKTHWDGEPNCEVITLTSDTRDVTTDVMDDHMRRLFRGEANTVVFYFAGHGMLDAETNQGYLVSKDHSRATPGLLLSTIIDMANDASPNIRSTVIILDSCHAGFVGEVSAIRNQKLALIGKGVTVLTAADRDQEATEFDGHGLFTGILLDGLDGSAADVLGRITPAALYSLVDQTLGGYEQRPVYKANVQRFITLRKVEPRVSPAQLRKIKDYFPSASHIFPVDPSFQEDRGQFTKEFRHIPVVAENAKVFKDMQAYYKVNLVAPVGHPFPWDAAMHSTGFRLTAQGAHYRQLALRDRIFV
ncbi:caspase domain-containing protein [Rhizobium leguminosarum]|uniref:caspase family protein n=1 Tax=Rhizobium leguminosarum TaxID=384 RepID=UPI0021B0FE7C|nr:caspase family protein [Rhizobium leguminosarum]